MQAAGAEWRVGPDWTVTAGASLYDYAHDVQRSPTGALPAAQAGGAGAVVDMGGTGWRTLDLGAGGRLGSHRLRLGAHQDRYDLSGDRYATVDWRTGPRGALTAASHGRTGTSALWAEDTAALSPDLDLTLGARWEHWRASGGLNYSLSPPLSVRQPARQASRVSPKAGLTWRPEAAWTLQARAGVAYRFPTVSELYQAVTIGQTLSAPDPALRPERAVSTELSAQRAFAKGSLRASLFTEDLTDALVSQTATGSSISTAFVQNVDKVRTYGLEIVGEARDAGIEGLDLSGSATWVHGCVRRDDAFPAAVGKRLPQVPEWRATAVASWRASDRLTLTAAARYGSRSWATLDNTDVVTHTYQGFDPYLVADLRAVWRFDAAWSAAVGVDNLGARDYFMFHPFPQRSVTAELKYLY
jgi:iron complex outermembrane receptor protein